MIGTVARIGHNVLVVGLAIVTIGLCLEFLLVALLDQLFTRRDPESSGE